MADRYNSTLAVAIGYSAVIQLAVLTVMPTYRTTPERLELVRIEPGRAQVEQQSQPLELEFVESNPAATGEVPRETSLLGEHNSVAQDLTEDAGSEEDLPETEGELDTKRLGADESENDLWDDAADEEKTVIAAVEEQQVAATSAVREVSEEEQLQEEPAEEEPTAIEAQEDSPPLSQPEIADEEIILAQAEQEPQRAVEPVSGTLRSEDAGAEREGKISFATNQSEWVPYFETVKRRIGQKWLPAITLDYKGSRRVKAVIEFKIAPDGSLADAKIADPGDDKYFAMVCLYSVRGAAPFPELPADVPDYLRENVLDIHFTFEYK